MQLILQLKLRPRQHQIGSWVCLALSTSLATLPGRSKRGGEVCRAGVTLTSAYPTSVLRDSMDSVKQSAALCLLRLYKASPDLVPMGEWTARVVHLLNDQHMVRPPCPAPRGLGPLP